VGSETAAMLRPAIIIAERRSTLGMVPNHKRRALAGISPGAPQAVRSYRRHRSCDPLNC
jgi:hypothetical protein